jgi:hypothetical protein
MALLDGPSWMAPPPWQNQAIATAFYQNKPTKPQGP